MARGDLRRGFLSFACVALLSRQLFVQTATIGDGSVSLVTGRAIDFTHQNQGCEVDGQTYASETSIPRQHPCHYCLCFQGKVDCFWKNCPPPPDQCTVLSYEDVCEPSLYHCPIPSGLKRVAASLPSFGKSSSAVSAAKSPPQGNTYFQPQRAAVAPNNVAAASQKQLQQVQQEHRFVGSNNNGNNDVRYSSNRQQRQRGGKRIVHHRGRQQFINKDGRVGQQQQPTNSLANLAPPPSTRQSSSNPDAYVVYVNNNVGASSFARPASVVAAPSAAVTYVEPLLTATPVVAQGPREGSGFKAPRKMEYFGTPFVPSPHIPEGQLAPEGDYFHPMPGPSVEFRRSEKGRSLRFRRVPVPANYARQPTGSATYFRPRRSANYAESAASRVKMSLPSISEPFPVDLTSPAFYEGLLSPSSPLPARLKRSINATIGTGGNGNFVGDRGCDILGIRYDVGEIIGVASDLCMECRCAAQSLFCSPKCCFEPAKPRLEARFLDQVSLSGPVKYANRPTASHPLQYLADQYGDGNVGNS